MFCLFFNVFTIIYFSECIHLLLAHGAPVKVKNSGGWSPLAEAISFGDRQTSMVSSYSLIYIDFLWLFQKLYKFKTISCMIETNKWIIKLFILWDNLQMWTMEINCNFVCRDFKFKCRLTFKNPNLILKRHFHIFWVCEYIWEWTNCY